MSGFFKISYNQLALKKIKIKIEKNAEFMLII